MVGVAVNVQPEPTQPGLLPEVRATLTEGVTEELTETVIVLDVPEAGDEAMPRIMLGRLVLVVPVAWVQAVETTPST